MNVLDRIRNLLKMSRSDNPHEAGQAAQRAQELMAQHRIDAAELLLDGSTEPRPPEEVVEERFGTSKKRIGWEDRIVMGCSAAFGCRTYKVRGRGYGVIGRKSDVEAYRYLYQYLCLEINRLCERGWAEARRRAAETGEMPRPSVWKNNFRVAAAREVRQRLEARQGEEAARLGLVVRDGVVAVPEGGRNETALVRAADAELRDADRIQRAYNVRVYGTAEPRRRRGGGRAYGAFSPCDDGRLAGQRAGASIGLDARGAIGPGARRLGT